MSVYGDYDEESIEWDENSDDSESCVLLLPSAADDVNIWIDALIELAVDAMQSHLFAEKYKTSSEEPIESFELRKAALLEFTKESNKFYKKYTCYLQLYKEFHDLFFNDGTSDDLIKIEAKKIFDKDTVFENIEIYEQYVAKYFSDKVTIRQEIQRTESTSSLSSTNSHGKQSVVNSSFFKKDELTTPTGDQKNITKTVNI